ncbi:MAG: hypothetical protein HUK21_01570 [Fibrobacteraceae bacterium]|nr:hypothetical protein [Fibrobacteraceae bacterium]
MAGLPPLRYLRKTTIVIIVVFLSFLGHRFYEVVHHEEEFRDVENTELSVAQSSVCRHIVSGSPFGVDSVFEEGTRLYFYSTINNANQYAGDSLRHVWFHGLDTIQTEVCKLSGDMCSSMIAPSLLTPGEWSVDLVAGRKMLSSKQFFVNSISR